MKKKKRECLKCSKLFKSEGRFNRICPRCAAANLSMREETRLFRIKLPEGAVLDKVSVRD